MAVLVDRFYIRTKRDFTLLEWCSHRAVEHTDKINKGSVRVTNVLSVTLHSISYPTFVLVDQSNSVEYLQHIILTETIYSD